jgi:hypothetical protein
MEFSVTTKPSSRGLRSWRTNCGRSNCIRFWKAHKTRKTCGNHSVSFAVDSIRGDTAQRGPFWMMTQLRPLRRSTSVTQTHGSRSSSLRSRCPRCATQRRSKPLDKAGLRCAALREPSGTKPIRRNVARRSFRHFPPVRSNCRDRFA